VLGGIGGRVNFTMNDGVVTSATHIRVAWHEGAVSTFTMNGGTVTAPAFLLIGEFSPAGSATPTVGTLNINGGTISGANYNLGQNPQAQGIVHQTGGISNATSNMVIGEVSRRDNLYDISGGALNVKNTANLANGSMFVGSSAGIGALTVSGTADVKIDGHIFAGNGATAVGTVNISGGSVALGLNKPGGGFLVAGEFGVSTVGISGGAVSMDFIQLGRRNNATSQGQTTQTGGDVTVRRSVTVGGLSPNNNFYDISAGTLNLTGVLHPPVGDPPAPNPANLNELQPGLHVARFSTGDPKATTGDPAVPIPVVPSNGRLTVSGTAAVTIAGGLYNSTGYMFQPPDPTPEPPGEPDNGDTPPPYPAPGGVGLIEMKGGTLAAASFLNGAPENAIYPAGGSSANYVQTGGTATLGHVTGSGNVAVSAGTMNVKSLRQAAANVSGTGLVNMAPDSSSAGTSNVKTLTIADDGTIDLAANKMLTETAVGTFAGGSYSGVHGYVQRAYHNGAWDRPGLKTSEPNAQPAVGTTTIGVASAEQILFIAPTATGTFSGQPVTGATTLAVYTYAGDLNIDGRVDAQDYGIIDNWVQFPGTRGYANGDINYDGVIDAADYGIIDNTIQLQGAPIPMTGDAAAAAAGLSGVSAVPEPGALSLLGVGAAALLSRRRRRRCGH
jgi:hypothetical protein